jgi:hypothetical protein
VTGQYVEYPPAADEDDVAGVVIFVPVGETTHHRPM